jgi:biotin carboxyl carrier protein
MIDKPDEHGKLRTIEGVYDTIITEGWKASRAWRPPNPNHLLAAIPGTVLQIIAEVGQTLKAGDPLLTLEAMKMENCIIMPFDGTIVAIRAEEGKLVKNKQLLVEIAPQDPM